MERFPSQLIHYADRVLILDPRRLLIIFREPIGREEVAPIIYEYGLRFEDDEQALKAPLPNRGQLVNHTESRFWVRSDDPINESLLVELEARDEIDWVAPVYHRADLEGKLAYLSPLLDVLLLQFREKVPRRTMRRIERSFNLTNVEEKTRHLGPFYYYQLPRGDEQGNRVYAYELRDQIKEREAKWVEDIYFESMPMISPIATTIPNDTHFGQQWTMNQINAPDGWDLSTGVNTVIIGVLDQGCDMSHSDLNFDGPGFNAGTGLNDGSAVGSHGTAVAGIAAAAINNAQGVAGVAGDCRIHTVAIPSWSDAEVAAAINEAANTALVHVINMSFGWNGWNPAIINPAIVNAHNVRGVVLCAATHNHDSNAITYPATHPLVIAVGASDQSDERRRPASPDGECWWGSNWGAELDVVAPGVLTWTTDRGGGAGYNQNGNPLTLTSTDAPCLGLGTLTYPSTGDAAGDYFANFNGTSAATPHVAGLAALLRSLYPALTNVEVRNIIERTCEKVSPAVYTYAYNPAKPSSTWNNEMGYGRINVFWALDFADVYIKDNPVDDGSVPFVGNFYSNSDIVVRQHDDSIFSYEPARRGQPNYIYVRVTNLGPATARNVTVSVRAVPFAGTEFIYPYDWTTVNATHISPTPVGPTSFNLAPGATVDAKFSLSALQVDDLYGWETTGWHPCLLAGVQCNNDYGVPIGVHTWQDNNLAQRNISTLPPATSGSLVLFPFVAGHKLNTDLYMELVVDRHKLPQDIELFLAPWDTKTYFPALELVPPEARKAITFLNRTRLALSLCGCDGILTLQAGSSFECGVPVVEDVSLQGAELVTHQGKRLIAIREDQAVIGFQKHPGEMRQMSLTFRVPDEVEPEVRYQIDVSQRNTRQEVVGGVTLAVEVTG